MAIVADEKRNNVEVMEKPALSDDRTMIAPADGGEESTPAKLRHAPPYIVVIDGPRIGVHFPLTEGQNIIGRATGCAVRLDDQSVSRQHAEIVKGASGWSVKDLGSKNGTSVNGKPVIDVVIIGHKDVVKTGIYQLRLITQPISVEDEMTIPAEITVADRTVFVSAPPESQTTKMKEKEVGMIETGEDESSLPEIPEGYFEQPQKSRRKLFMYGALGLVFVATLAYFASRAMFSGKEPVSKKTPITQPSADSLQADDMAGPDDVGPPDLPPPGVDTVPPTPPGKGIPQAITGAEQPQPDIRMPVFLDFASSPMPADVTFRDEKIGKTPLRINVELEPGKTYEAVAFFNMPEMKEILEQKLEFTVEKDSNVIPILFRGPIGIIKINDLPRDVEFYLEGKFTHDRFQERSSKLTEIVLQKPIYIPYGEYHLELRRSRQLGQTSQTYVSDIIFRRDFVIAEDAPSFVMEAKEDDLRVFPVNIKSDPPNANVYIDGKNVGKTPYEGLFPLGEHKMTVRKEGFFEHSEDLKVDINTPFVASVKLKTSIAGAHLNNAKLSMDRQMWQEAINELAEALGSEPVKTEIAQANYMLGVCYLSLNDIQRAMGYFEQARADEEVGHRAMLGLVRGYALMDRIDKGLPLLVEVLLKGGDEDIKREANDLFQKISPFRSVLYIYSEPPGAQVTVNGKPVQQKTPVILHELPLGSYKLKIEKPGYLPQDLNLSMSVNEFNPIIVQLKSIPQ